MALEPKEILTALGLPDTIDKVEDLVAASEKRFVVRDKAHEDEAVRNKLYGDISREHEGAFIKAFGIEKGEIEGKKFKEIIGIGAQKMTDKMKALEETAGKGNDEKVKELSGKLEKVTGQLNEYKGNVEKLINEKTELQNSYEGKLKGIKTATIYQAERQKLPFADGLPKAALVGFDAIINSKYKIDVDDKDNPIVTDINGKQIPNPKQTGVYLNLKEVLDMELEEQGLKKKNNLPAGQQSFQHQRTETVQGNNGNNNRGNQSRSVNPRALANAERLAADAKNRA